MNSVARSWSCHVCGAEAGSLDVGEGGEVRRASFTGVLTESLAPEPAARLRDLLRRDDAAALHSFDPELAPWWCPDCGAGYCGDHWMRWDVFDDDFPVHRDSIRGRCPQGHERMLED